MGSFLGKLLSKRRKRDVKTMSCLLSSCVMPPAELCHAPLPSCVMPPAELCQIFSLILLSRP